MAMFVWWLSLIALTTSKPIVHDQADTCTQVERLHPNITVARPGGYFSEYAATQREYWNRAASSRLSSCTLYPRNTYDVSNIVKVLNSNNENFAVKGGGHNPNKDLNSINGGPLIALEKMLHLQYDASTHMVDIGPGNRWHDVANHTDQYNRTALTARMGHVGVPGLLLGGGLSFLSTEYGWASTHVKEYELVLPNGTIALANTGTNKDLYRALQGSGGIMGIVTRFRVSTFPIGQVWGGTRVYSGSHTPEILQAIRHFTENYPDPKAALIATSEIIAYGTLTLWIIFFFYNGPVVPDDTFQSFKEIPHIISYTKTQSMRDLLIANNWYSFTNVCYTVGTETLPLPAKENATEVLSEVFRLWKDTSRPFTNTIAGAISSVAFQPLPKGVSEATKRHGGNIMDMGDGHRIIFEYHYSYIFRFQSNDDLADFTMKQLIDRTGRAISTFVEQGKVPNITRALFQNDAHSSQDFWGRFQQTDFMAKVKRSVDPKGMFSSRTMSWKL